MTCLHSHTSPLPRRVLDLRVLLHSHLLFFFNAPAPTEIYTLSLHDALPISGGYLAQREPFGEVYGSSRPEPQDRGASEKQIDRKSTRLNSSHMSISYAVFCLKKKNKPSSRSTPRL